MNSRMTVGVIGLGLIGGSLAKALKAHTAHRVLGGDIDGAVVQKALAQNAVDGVADADSLGECDVLLLALYPGAVRAFFAEHIQQFRKGALVVDCAGVKRGICTALAAEAKVTFIGGHPMAGIEKSGYDNSFAGLFSGASMILCADADAPMTRVASELFLELGFGRVTYTTADEHDRMIAYTSQLAHIVSSAYVRSKAAYRHSGYSANSFKDLTRVARLDERMWTELFFENSDYLISEAEGVAERLQEYITALKTGDRALMRRILREGTLAKEASERGEG